jgi:hypothetical protein
LRISRDLRMRRKTVVLIATNDTPYLAATTKPYCLQHSNFHQLIIAFSAEVNQNSKRIPQ